MALKRQQEMLATFSMASMTDVIFLLLVFFMVTSTYIFPTAIEVNLPEGTEQTPEKPTTRVFIDADGSYYLSIADSDLEPVPADSLVIRLQDWHATEPEAGIAVYADTDVAYGKVVEVLNMGAANALKMVLATRPGDNQQPAATSSSQPSIESAQ